MDTPHERGHRGIATAVAAVWLLILLSGCADSTGPAPQLSGTFDLLEYEGRGIPVDDGPLPTRTGGISSCRSVVADGALSLDPDRRRFTLHYSVRSSCNSGILSQPGESGNYEATNRTLRFGSSIGDFDGEVREDGAIAVEFFDRALVFAGPPHRAPRAKGQFDLVDLVEAPIESTEAASPPVESDCTLVIDHGILTLLPASDRGAGGRFDLDYALRSSCTGELRRRSDESGSYEQVATSLEFVGEISPNVVHPFRGRVREEGVVLFIGHDLVFHSAVTDPGQ